MTEWAEHMKYELYWDRFATMKGQQENGVFFNGQNNSNEESVQNDADDDAPTGNANIGTHNSSD